MPKPIDGRRFVQDVEGPTDHDYRSWPLRFGPRTAPVASAIAWGATAFGAAMTLGATVVGCADYPTVVIPPDEHVPAQVTPRPPDGGARDGSLTSPSADAGEADGEV